MTIQEHIKESDTNNASDSKRPIQNDENSFAYRLKVLIGDDSIRQFARKCNVHESTIRTYLSGGKTPRMEHLISIATACGVTVDWLTTGKGIKYTKDLKHAQERLNGAPPRAYGELPATLKPYEKRLDALLYYLAMIDDEAEVEQILSEVTLRAEKVIELTDLKKTVNEMRAEYLKKNANGK